MGSGFTCCIIYWIVYRWIVVRIWKFILIFSSTFHAVLSSADFLKIQLIWKILYRIPSDSQTVWIQIRPDILSGLFWVQTFCKGNQQTALGGKELNIQVPITTPADNIFSELSLFSGKIRLDISFESSTESSNWIIYWIIYWQFKGNVKSDSYS